MNDNVSHERKVEIAELLCIMRSQGGRDFIRRLLDVTGVYSNSFSDDHDTLVLNTGKREIGLWIESELIQTVPDMFIQMTKERIEDE